MWRVYIQLNIRLISQFSIIYRKKSYAKIIEWLLIYYKFTKKTFHVDK